MLSFELEDTEGFNRWVPRVIMDRGCNRCVYRVTGTVNERAERPGREKRNWGRVTCCERGRSSRHGRRSHFKLVATKWRVGSLNKRHMARKDNREPRTR